MMIMLKANANTSTVEARLRALGLWTQRLSLAAAPAASRSSLPQSQSNPASAPASLPCALQIQPGSARVDDETIAAIEGVAAIYRGASPHARVDELAHSPHAQLSPSRGPIVMAGPCSVESEQQIELSARLAAAAGAHYLRGGAFKPRTSPDSFRGHGQQALAWLSAAGRRHDLRVVTEAMSEGHADLVAEHADLIQVGTRNMSNYALLWAIGKTGKPVLLKRGMAATVSEWLQAGEHLLAAGASDVIFCERGVRGFDAETRFLLDLGAVALLTHVYGQRVIVDPSHAAGRRDLVVPLALAAQSSGAIGVMVEMHPSAQDALSDGPQAITPAQLQTLAKALFRIDQHPSRDHAS